MYLSLKMVITFTAILVAHFNSPVNNFTLRNKLDHISSVRQLFFFWGGGDVGWGVGQTNVYYYL